MKTLIPLVIALAAGATGLAQEPPTENGLATEFALLVGFPSGDEPAEGGVVLVPGTVIPLGAEGAVSRDEKAVERSLQLTRAIDKLWTTFRLDPLRRVQRSRLIKVPLDSPVELPGPPDSDVKISATLLGFNDQVATFRVIFRQGEESLADSTVSVAMGGRAVVAGIDGAAAPYIFVLVQPDPPYGAITKWKEDIGISQPVVKEKVIPPYPAAARPTGVQGVVVLESMISAAGTVLDVRVLESPDPSLAEAAVEALRQWRFEPARATDGTALSVSFILTFKFSLE
jgi:TonB family protein